MFSGLIIFGAFLFLVSCASAKNPEVRFIQMTDTHIITTGSPTPSTYDGRLDNCNSDYLASYSDFYSLYCNTQNYNSTGGSTAPTIGLNQSISIANTYSDVNFTIFTGDIVAQGTLNSNKTDSLNLFTSLADRLNSPYYVLGASIHDEVDRESDLAEYASLFGSMNQNFTIEDNLFIILSQTGSDTELPSVLSYNLTYLNRTLESYKNQNLNLFIFVHIIPVDVFRGFSEANFFNLMGSHNGEFKSMLVIGGHNHANTYYYQNYTHWITTTATMNYPVEFRIFDIYDDHIHIYMSNDTSPEISNTSERLLEKYILENSSTLDGTGDDSVRSNKLTFYGEGYEREINIGTRFINVCDNLTEEGGYYTLNTSVDASSFVTCFNITNNSVTLDLNGYNITGNLSLTNQLIYSRNYDNCTIRNGKMYYTNNVGTEAAVYLENGDNHIIKNISIYQTGRGFFVHNSSNNYFEDIIIYNSSNSGIQNGALMLKGSNNNTLNRGNFTLAAKNLIRLVFDDSGSSNNIFRDLVLADSEAVSDDIKSGGGGQYK